MLEIVMLVICIVLLFNLVTAMIVLGRRQGNSWLLALLLTGTTGAASAALVAISVSDQPARFVDLSLVLMGLASLPVVLRVMLDRDRPETREADHAD